VGKVYETIDERWRAWIAEQHMFVVATAPSEGGLVNCSPKGLEGLRVLGDREVAYLDFIGSGVETLAHLRDNGRITLMFCAFSGPPKILRLQGRGDAVFAGDPEWDALAANFPEYPNTRSIVRVRVDRIADSCGYGVPLMEHREDRTQLEDWASRKTADELVDYQLENNLESLDGLPGVSAGRLR
jgi:hypothetical protein